MQHIPVGFIFTLSFISAQALAQAPQKLYKEAEASTSLDSAVMLYEQSISEARKAGDDAFADSVMFSLGKKYISKGKLLEARELAEAGLERNTANYKSNLTAGFYNIKAVTFHHLSNLDSALTYYLKAVAELEARNDTAKAASIRFNIGNIFLSYRDWEQANKHFKLFLDVIEREKDSTYLAGVLSSLSATQFEMGNEKQSRIYAEKGLRVAKKRNDALGQMLSYRQLGQIANNNNHLDSAIQYYSSALEIAEMIKMPYYLAMINMNLCEAYGKAGQTEAAIECGKSSLKYSEDPGFATQLPAAYRFLSEAYRQKGDFANAHKYLSLSTELRDEEINKENKKIVNELLVKYESEKKDRQIVEQKLQISQKEKQNFIYLAAVVFAILVIGFLVWLMGLRQRLTKARIKQMEQEKEQELLYAIVKGEEQERSRLARALHDGLSNMLFTCKLSLSSISGLPSSEQEKMNSTINRLDELHEDTRRLSHNLMPLGLEKQSLTEALDSYVQKVNEASPKTNLFFQSFGEKKAEFSSSRRILLYRAVQEIVGNAIKHADANEIAVQFFYTEENLKIVVEDDGKGYDSTEIAGGEGLKSLEQRIKLMNGELQIESQKGQGTIVSIIINS